MQMVCRRRSQRVEIVKGERVRREAGKVGEKDRGERLMAVSHRRAIDDVQNAVLASARYQPGLRENRTARTEVLIADVAIGVDKRCEPVDDFQAALTSCNVSRRRVLQSYQALGKVCYAVKTAVPGHQIDEPIIICGGAAVGLPEASPLFRRGGCPCGGPPEGVAGKRDDPTVAQMWLPART